MLWTPTHNFKLPKQPVMEKYVGSSPNIEKALSALSKIVKDINSKPYLDMQVSVYDNSKENEIICRMFEKEFGFRKMELMWDNSTVPNAYTITGGALINPSPGLSDSVMDMKGRRYHDQRHIYECYVTIIMDIIRSLNLTPRETMALLLHEIGHNFDNLWTTQASYGMSMLFSFIILPDVIRSLAKVVYKGIQEIRKSMPKLMFAIDAIMNLPYHLSIVRIPNIYRLVQYANVFGGFQFVASVRSEYYSDQFAANYGFGPDLTSAFMKMSDRGKIGGASERVFYNIPGLRSFFDIIAGPATMLCLLLDEHPFEENRILSVRQNLENDLNDPNTPRGLKPEIKRQIKMIDNYIEVDAQNNAESGLFFQALRKYFIYNCPIKNFYHR